MVVAVVVVVMSVMVIVAVIAAMAMIMVMAEAMMMGITIGSGITSRADSSRSSHGHCQEWGRKRRISIRTEHTLPSSRLWAMAAWARRSYGNVDAAILVRRNHDVAP
jgi:hypothetical protein